MIQKEKLYYPTLDAFLAKKASADKKNKTFRTGSLTADVQTGEPDIMYQAVVYIKGAGIWTHGSIISGGSGSGGGDSAFYWDD